jgi:hypothetical protein
MCIAVTTGVSLGESLPPMRLVNHSEWSGIGTSQALGHVRRGFAARTKQCQHMGALSGSRSVF